MSKLTTSSEVPAPDRRAGTQGKQGSVRASRPSAKAQQKSQPSALPALGHQATTPAQQRAAVILEVLAGEHTAVEAARLLGITAMHYYLLERRALEGLVAACEPRPKGPSGPTPEQEASRLRRELERSRRECLRHAALVRATQRALGVPHKTATVAKESPERAAGKGRRRRRTTVRALRAAQSLRRNSSGLETAGVVERSPLEGSTGEGSALDTNSVPSPMMNDRSRKAMQEAGHDTPGQEAGGHGACGATGRLGSGQASDADVPGNARG